MRTWTWVQTQTSLGLHLPAANPEDGVSAVPLRNSRHFNHLINIQELGNAS